MRLRPQRTTSHGSRECTTTTHQKPAQRRQASAEGGTPFEAAHWRPLSDQRCTACWNRPRRLFSRCKAVLVATPYCAHGKDVIGTYFNSDVSMDENQKVWRYMGFSRFMWMLQHHQLWMARADKLDDPWELAITNDEIDLLMGRHPIPTLDGPPQEPALTRINRITDLWRRTTFINCWCANNHESHALWRVFCGPKEGVTIQTTWGKLQQLAGNMRLVEVDYTGYEGKIRTPNLNKVSIRKRHMFDYEHEVRIIAQDDTPNPNLIRGEFGFQLPFDPAVLIDAIWVHPEADESFNEVVVAAVDTYASSIRDRVKWSAMREPPPQIIVG